VWYTNGNGNGNGDSYDNSHGHGHSNSDSNRIADLYTVWRTDNDTVHFE